MSKPKIPSASKYLAAVLVFLGAVSAQAQGNQYLGGPPPGEGPLNVQIGFNQNTAPGLVLLKPPATSSPRDTLRSFLTGFNEAARAFYQDKITVVSQRAFERAMETLDFSTTPDGDSWSVQIIRTLKIKEILDRVEIPPDHEIPGVHEVKENGITEWSIPDTGITLRRIEVGPNAGQFLFSARTVELADKYYRQVKNAPYKPGPTRGILEAYLASEDNIYALGVAVRNRLKPLSTSSPRWVLQGFLESVNSAYRLIVEAEAALEATPPTITEAQALEAEATANMYLRRAMGALDLSKVPAAQRPYVGLDAVLKIKEVIDRTTLPRLSSVPSEHKVAAARKGERLAFMGNDLPLRWRIPNTELEIAEVTEGDRNGEFLFSAQTVRNVGKYFADVQDLPYRSDRQLAVAQYDYNSPAVSEGFYKLITATPGYLVPSAHFLSNVVNELPDLFKTLHGEQAVWQWLGFVITVLAVVVASYTLIRVCRSLRERLAEPWNHWVLVLLPITIALLLKGTEWFFDHDLNLTGEFFFGVVAVIGLAVFAMIGWSVYIVSVAIAETVIYTPKIPDESIDASLLRIAARILGVLISGWIFIDGVDDIGLDVVPLIASLGVGGLAVALAAQTTIANLIGSVILYANRPVRVGDFCRYGGEIGTVEEIGVHSTRIRTLERSVVTVPNAEFAQMKLDNFTRRDQRLLRTTLQLRYETTPDQLRYILAKLRELLLGHPMVTPDPARVRLVGYGAYSLNVEIFAYLRCQDHNTFLAMQEDVLLRMADIVKEGGSGFAFPSQTAYLARDQGLDAEQGGEATAQVEQWRSGDKLPFPEFVDEERQRLEDTLDYPPKGSPDHGLPDEQSESEEQECASTSDDRKDRI